MLFAKAKGPTPVLNTPHFKTVFSHPLPLCDQGLLRPVELVALPNTPFEIKKQCSEWIYHVAMPSYPADGLYVDGRFLIFSTEPSPQPHLQFPSAEALLDTLYSRVGLPYIWGGNWSPGIPELLEYYPPLQPISEKERSIHTLHGVDCSGLLYEATFGLTPRNTPGLLHFGTPLDIEGKTPAEIAPLLAPLDLIVWKGHVVIVGKGGETIESHGLHGVFVTPLIDQLSKLMKTKRAVNLSVLDPNAFVVRRWNA